MKKIFLIFFLLLFSNPLAEAKGGTALNGKVSNVKNFEDGVSFEFVGTVHLLIARIECSCNCGQFVEVKQDAPISVRISKWKNATAHSLEDTIVRLKQAESEGRRVEIDLASPLATNIIFKGHGFLSDIESTSWIYVK